MRNLRGFRFPAKMSPEEAVKVERLVRSAAAYAGLEAPSSLTQAVRDYLVMIRAVSPDFRWFEPGRTVLLDETKSLSVMINEEDHLRIQALGPGWSLTDTMTAARQIIKTLSRQLEFAESPTLGYLASSPLNTGQGVRCSVLVHALGLAHSRKLSPAIEALGSEGLTVRGLYGETTRATGAFLQISAVNFPQERFRGAVSYFVEQEMEARKLVTDEALLRQARMVMLYALRSHRLSLADSLRVISWIRWATTLQNKPMSVSHRDVDTHSALIELKVDSLEPEASRARRTQEWVEKLGMPIY
jgi:protein arginine kinase